jgi:hypothetical protein
MTDQTPGSDAAKAIGDPLGTVVGWMAGLLPEGPARTLLFVVTGLSILAAPFIYKYYLGLLAQGAQLEGSLERHDYDELRTGLAGDNLAARIYAKWLTGFLDWVEHFFCDAGMGDRTLFPHAFGLKKPMPLWTAPAFDRCLLLALIYPVVTILIVWAISGHVGPAEAALGLQPETPSWLRGLATAAIGFSSFAFLRGFRAQGWKSRIWFAVAFAGVVNGVGAGAGTGGVAVAVAVAVAFVVPRAAGVTFSGVIAGAATIAIAVTVAVVFGFGGGVAFEYVRTGTDFRDALFAGALWGVVTGALSGAIAFVVAVILIGAIAVTFASTGSGTGTASGTSAVAGAVAFGVAIAFTGSSFSGSNVIVDITDAIAVAISAAVAIVIAVAVAALSAFTIRKRSQAVFLLLFLLVMILACFAAAPLTSLPEGGGVSGPLLLFLGLLTLLNAPFDWASLGLTRALLRRGLELGGWWPYLLALADATLAGAIVALLALVMVIGVQAFDELAVHDGGKAVLPLDALFDGIATNPAAPEYWWAYAILLSSMIPSLINLAIGGTAFTRGIPWLARLLLQWMPEGKALPDYKRPLAAIGLTTQMFAGVGLGIAAQAFLVWGLIFHVMPWIGLDLLDMARAVAAFDVPARIGALFAGTA